MGHPHRMESSIDIPGPKIQEAMKYRELGSEVELLPDISLENLGVVGQVIEDFSRR